MDSRELLQNSIDYIEENLKAETSVEELACMTGFSLFYYYRIFQNTIGISVMQYITRLKLLNAIYEISRGNKMIDVALCYGFETHAGFYKAFVREFSLSPSTYLKKHKAKKPYKINLIQEEHIMITHKKATEILKYWNLDSEKISDVYYENTDNKNDHTFYIGNNFVLKFSSNSGQLKNHIEISKALEKAGVLSAVPIHTISGEDIVKDGELYACLTKRLKGKQIKSCDLYEGDYQSKSRFIGEILGQIHLILEKFDVAVNDNDLFSTVKNWALPKTKELMELDEKFADNFLETFEKLYTTLPKQTIHRDPNLGNFIVDGNSFGFIDFDLSERNVRIYDPCYASTAILSETINDIESEKLEIWIEIYKNIIYGYDSIVKLSTNEKIAIPYIVIANQLICCAWFSEQEKYKELYKTCAKMTKWIVDNFDKLVID